MEVVSMIPATVQNYLNAMQIPFDVVHHEKTLSSMRTALVAHVPPQRIAKAVLLSDGGSYLMAVLPADRHVHLGLLREQLGRRINLANEREIMDLFGDCELGAIPAVGGAYGLDMIVDDELMEQPEVYFEAGDHEDLIRVSRENFLKMFKDAPHWHFGRTH
jgi:Ala-tRNA(Pro) deacylase